MMVQRKKLIFGGLALTLLLAKSSAINCYAAENTAFVTKNGYSLTQEQYDKVSQVYEDDVLYLQDNETIDYWLQDDVEIISGDTLYIQVDELYDVNGEYLGEYERELTEQEATVLEKKIAKNGGQPLISNDFATLTSLAAKVTSTKSSAIKPYEEITTMKKLTMTTSNQAAITSKNMVLTLQWLAMPNIRSFDIIAIRPGVECTFYNNNIKHNLKCQQIYDSGSGRKIIEYDSFGDHCIKKLGSGIAGGNKMDGHHHGCGFSMNLVNAAKKITCVMEMTVDTSKNNFVAYGSYQHATKNVSLAESKKYSISYEGLGKVILFDNKVKEKYDGMNGVARVYN